MNGSSLSGTRVLTIDGHENARAVLRTILEWNGAVVYEADSRAEGLMIAKDLRPDVILCEFQISELKANELLEEVRALMPARRPIPVIAVTALDSFGDYVRAYRQGFDYLLVKPVNPSELVRAIEDTLGKNE